jgi:hypothetical protein
MSVTSARQVDLYHSLPFLKTEVVPPLTVNETYSLLASALGILCSSVLGFPQAVAMKTSLGLSFVGMYAVVLALADHGDDYAENMGPVAFLWPSDREWGAAKDNTAPCGSAAGVSNRTRYPLCMWYSQLIEDSVNKPQ